jgi:superfamily II DNA helicase RecQ
MLKTGAPKMLIYTLTKNAACKVYEMLSKSVHDKECIGMYHASLTSATKAHIHMEFREMGLCVAWSQPLLLAW